MLYTVDILAHNFHYILLWQISFLTAFFFVFSIRESKNPCRTCIIYYVVG